MVEGKDELNDFAAAIPARMDALKPKNWSNFDMIVEAASRAWEAVHRDASLQEIQRSVEDVFPALSSGALTVADRVRLRGLALALRRFPDRDVEEVLDRLLSVRSPTGRDTLAKYLLVPLLATGEHSTREEPGVAAARRYCASRLRPTDLSRPDIAQGAAGIMASALGQQKRLRLPCAVVAACLPEETGEGDDPRGLDAWLVPPWPTVLTVRAAAGGNCTAMAALRHWLAAYNDLASRAKSGGAEIRDEVAKRVGECPELLTWLLEDARSSRDTAAVRHLAQSPGQAIRNHPHLLHELAVQLIGGSLATDRDAGFRLLTELVQIGHAPSALTPTRLAELLVGERNHQVFRKIVDLANAHLLRDAPLWSESDPADPESAISVMAPVLRRRIAAGERLLAQERYTETGDREQILAGNDAHRLLLTLHAVLSPIEPGAWNRTKEHVYRLAFEPLTAHLPPDSAGSPYVWGQRLAALPRLALRLAKVGRIQDGIDLMDQVIDAVKEADPDPRSSWKDRHANPWRPFLRTLACYDKDHMADRVRALAERDEYFARHLIEVGSQELADVSTHLYTLLRSDLSPSLLLYVRKTAEWAGRAGTERPWTDLYTQLEAATRS